MTSATCNRGHDRTPAIHPEKKVVMLTQNMSFRVIEDGSVTSHEQRNFHRCFRTVKTLDVAIVCICVCNLCMFTTVAVLGRESNCICFRPLDALWT